jgi:lysyl endopeptidase
MSVTFRACAARARSLAACVLAVAIAMASPYALATASFGEADVVELVRAQGLLPFVRVGEIDAQALRERDARLAKANGDVRKDLRVAEGLVVMIDSDKHGLWLDLDDGSSLWLIEVEATGASELHLGFDQALLPSGARLSLVSGKDATVVTSDGPRDGPFWPAMVPGDRVALLLSLPAGSSRDAQAIRLAYVGAGYRHLFSEQEDLTLKSGGDCLVDVVCPVGDDYRDPARAVARYTFRRNGFTYLCTGSMVANTGGDLRPLFLTAHHCVGDAAVAATVVLYFNYQSATCGARTATLPTAHTGGALLRAGRADVDTSLLELVHAPAPERLVFYAGWDRSGSVPQGSIGIDHPLGRVKSIVENTAALHTTNSCIMSGTQSTHWRTSAYAQGVTMPGSSGSMLLVPAHDGSGHGGLITGVLSGGSSACNGSMPNQHGDCYGKLAVAWDGPEPGSRLRDWLDPLGVAPPSLAGYPGPRPEAILSVGFEG